MTLANPYEPSVDAESPAGRQLLIYAWNVTIGGLIALLAVVACFGIKHFHERAYASDTSNWIATEIFLRELFGSLAPLTGLGLFLLSITTFALHTHKRRWQSIYATVVVILAFDFYSMTFTSAAMARACCFAVLFLPVLVCGYCWPRALSRSIAFLRPRS